MELFSPPTDQCLIQEIREDTWKPMGGLGPPPTLISLYCKPDSVVTIGTCQIKLLVVLANHKHQQQIVMDDYRHQLDTKLLEFHIICIIQITSFRMLRYSMRVWSWHIRFFQNMLADRGPPQKMYIFWLTHEKVNVYVISTRNNYTVTWRKSVMARPRRWHPRFN